MMSSGKLILRISNFYARIPEKKVKEFYYKLVHRILVSKNELYSYGITDNSIFHYCGEQDSILGHTFIECHHSKEFFNKTLKRFNEENITSFVLNDEKTSLVKLLIQGRYNNAPSEFFGN